MTETQQAQVLRIADLTPHVREVVLLPDGAKIGYRPGQWVSIKVPVDGKPPLNRAYTMAEPEQPTGHLPLVFDRVPGGLGSDYLYSLRPGDRVSLSGPHGKFVLPEGGEQGLMLIGRYTGIVPIRCMLRALPPTDDARDVTVIAVAPSIDERLYHDELTAQQANRARLRYHPIVSPAGEETAHVMELVRDLIGERRDVVPMICGLKGFVRPLRTAFMELGFDRREVKIETYD